jgi:HD-GYP domain-containing protein (c-di-GMP phosphodiesterase class II)
MPEGAAIVPWCVGLVVTSTIATALAERVGRAAEQILSLVAALSAHDGKTRGHSERVRAFTDLLGSQLRIQADDRGRLRWPRSSSMTSASSTCRRGS